MQQQIVSVIQMIQPFMLVVFVTAFATMVAANVFIAKQNFRVGRFLSLATAILSGIVMLVECATFAVTFSVCNAILGVLWGYMTYSYANRYNQLKGK